MTDNMIAVPMGEIRISDNPNDVLVAYGLGSCVAICLYDPAKQLGGMLHALLPASPNNGNRDPGKPTKFVDRGVPLLVETLTNRGASRDRLVAQLCGGAKVISIPGEDKLNIGARNVKAAKHALKMAGLDIHACETGGRVGRTARFYLAEGLVTVRSLTQEEHPLKISKSGRTTLVKGDKCV